MDEIDVKRTLTNPYYAVNFDPILFEDHEHLVSEEEWVKVNAKLIQDIGPEEWLKQLLEVLKGQQS